MTTMQNGLTAGNSQPAKMTFNQDRHFTPNHRKNAQIRHQHGATLRPGASHTKDIAVATFAEKKVFSRPEFFGTTGNCRSFNGLMGLGVSIPQGRQHGDIHVTKPSPTIRASHSISGLKSHIGANQMATSQSTTTPTTGTTHDHTLPFVKVEYKGPRKQRLTDWFAVPDEDYGTGNATGYRVAAEMMAWLQSQPATYEIGMIVREIMAAAFEVLAEPHTPGGKPDKRGAAVTFLDAMAECVMFTAKNGSHQAYLEGRAQHSEDWAKKSAEMDAERNRQTGLRLAAARKAKREARMAESGVKA